MIFIKSYIYPNTLIVQLIDPSIFTDRNRLMYSREIKVYQGIDNPIQIQVMNQDQKPVNLTGYSMQLDIQDPTNQVTVKSYAVNFSNISQGQGTVVLDATTLNSLENRFYKLTTRTIQLTTNSQAPAYVDDNYGVNLDLKVLPAYYSITEPSPGVDNSVIDGGTL